MKLKTILIIFNVLIGLSFLFVFLMPAFFLGWDYAGVFWKTNWYLAVLFAAVFVILNTYFAGNWKLFSALEREDWRAVSEVLEQRVYKRRDYSRGNVRLLVNAYVVLSEIEKISALETELRKKSYRAMKKNALVLGIPHLLSNDGAEIASYYGEFIDQNGATESDWMRWCNAFGLMLQQRTEDARYALKELCAHAKDTIVRGLSAYLLDAYAQHDTEDTDRISNCRKEITDRYDRSRWRNKVENERANLYVLILGKLIRDVEEWLYGEQR